ncbi:MAG: hypothetical protein CVV27_09350 [Candidatus Melainabacteria bacterium HGW-Melainabacteria-1]|nr:MAG: hypothetical protein CVV27_09350 [Candidatus Melainabacteria bacterium HGW-Melainabacteria-1]
MLRLSLISLLLLCSCNATTAPNNPQTPASPAASPAASSPETDPAIWLGEWGGGSYGCSAGDKITDDGIRIEAGEIPEQLKLTLYLSTATPVSVKAQLKTADQIEIPTQDINGAEGSGSLSLKDGSLTLAISALDGLITCQGTGYRKK